MNWLKLFTISAAFAGSTSLAVAQEAASQSAAMSFLDIPLSPRAAAMGGVSAGQSADAYAHFGNVAAIPFTDGTLQAGASYGMWQPDAADMTLATVGATYNLGQRFGISLGVMAGIHPSYVQMDSYGIAGDEYTPMDLRIGAGFAYRATDALSAGVALNYVRSTLAPSADLNSFSVDVQVLYRIKDFDISLSGNNLGAPVKSLSGEKYNLPMNVELAVGYAKNFGKHRVAAGIEGQGYFLEPTAFTGSVGAEYVFDGLASVRAGYHAGSDENGLPSFTSVGVGVKLFGANLDAAYLITGSDSPLKNTFTVGIGYSF